MTNKRWPGNVPDPYRKEGRREGSPSLLPSLLMNWAENGFQYKFFQPTSQEGGQRLYFIISFSSPPPHRWAGKTYTGMFFLVINQPCYMRMLFSHLSLSRMGFLPPRASCPLGPRAALCGPRGHDALGGENPFCLGIRYENTPYLGRGLITSVEYHRFSQSTRVV